MVPQLTPMVDSSYSLKIIKSYLKMWALHLDKRKLGLVISPKVIL